MSASGDDSTQNRSGPVFHNQPSEGVRIFSSSEYDEEQRRRNEPRTDTTPIPVQGSTEPEVSYLYDERLHIKYLFTFYSSTLYMIVWAFVAAIFLPAIIGLVDGLRRSWAELEEVPVVGVLAQVVRLIVEAILKALWGAVTAVADRLGLAGVITLSVIAFIAVLIFVILLIRPIYAWRKSRIRISLGRAEFLQPGHKLLFLDEHNIIIKDTSIIRGATEQVSAFDKWVFPGAASVHVEKDDLGGNNDNLPWEPVRHADQLIAAIDQVIKHHKSQAAQS